MGYFYTCNTTDIINDGGSVVENTNGTVSLFVTTGNLSRVPTPITKSCCEALNPNYMFNTDTQECRWSEGGCSTDLIIYLI